MTFHWLHDGVLRGYDVHTTSALGSPVQAVVRFEYDGHGRPVRKTVNGTARHFLWQGHTLLAELGADGLTVEAEHSAYPGVDDPHAVVRQGQAHFTHTDGLGNVIALSRADGTLSRQYAYDDWGVLTGGQDPGGWAGRDRARWKGALGLGEEAGLVWLRNRWYEPGAGRFVSEDPLGDIDTPNRYLFVGNDPVNGADPSGLCPWCLLAAGRGLFSVAQGAAAAYVTKQPYSLGDAGWDFVGGALGGGSGVRLGGGVIKSAVAAVQESRKMGLLYQELKGLTETHYFNWNKQRRYVDHFRNNTLYEAKYSLTGSLSQREKSQLEAYARYAERERYRFVIKVGGPGGNDKAERIREFLRSKGINENIWTVDRK
ncbi:MAG: RHS repeat-associated core domain-containing protein [Gemmatimonadales bacterium]|nr:RHS repeat-associated core domain-containing protein [Gemmatimonadales bacterium]